MFIKKLLTTGLVIVGFTAFEAHSVPVLQLGPTADDTGAVYDETTQTWIVSEDESGFSFNAYNLGTDSLTAYIVLAADPEMTTDVFDVVVSDGTATISLYDSGYGTPPFEDPNSLASHDIYSTWSEIYEITFDGALVDVYDVQPGSTGVAEGYMETISVSILGMDASLTGIHVDMFTAEWDAESSKQIVTGFAPFSHDAQFNVPVPAAMWLFGSGLIGMVAVARRRS